VRFDVGIAGRRADRHAGDDRVDPPALGRGAARLDSGAESRLGWLETPRSIPLFVAGSGPRMLEAAGLSPEAQTAVRRLRDAYDSYQHPTAASRHRELVPDRFVDRLALAGDPAEVREQVRRVMSVPEIGRIIILPQNPGQGFLEREAILRTFAEQVMARLG
jgi:hypothetical protein